MKNILLKCIKQDGKLLLKGFGKKDISKLIKKQIINKLGKKQIVYVRGEKEKPKSHRQKKIENKIRAYKGMLFEAVLTNELTGRDAKEFIFEHDRLDKMFSKIPEDQQKSLLKDIADSKEAINQYYDGKKIESAEFIGEDEKTYGLGHKADILVKATDKKLEAFENTTKQKNLAISVKTIHGKEVSSTNIKLSSIGSNVFRDLIGNVEEWEDLSKDKIKHNLAKELNHILGDSRYPDMVMFLKDMKRDKFLFLKEKDLSKALSEKIAESRVEINIDKEKAVIRNMRFFDKDTGKKILKLELPHKRFDYYVTTPYRTILNLAKEIKLK